MQESIKGKSQLNLAKGIEQIENIHTSSTSSKCCHQKRCTSHSKSSHKINTNSSQKSSIPPTLPYTRQYKYKVKKALPKNLEESCAVIGSLVREKLRNEDCRRRLEFEIPELQNSQQGNINKEISMALKWGAKGKFAKVARIKDNIKKKYSSLRKASKGCPDLSWKTFHKIFNPKILHQERRVKTSDLEHIHNIMKSSCCSIQLSSKKHNKVHYLIQNLRETYAEYVKEMKRKDHCILAFSTFCTQRPRCVKLQRQIPMNQCGCDRCLNFQLVLTSLTANGVKCITARSTESVISTMFEVEGRPHDLLEYNCDCLFQLCRRYSNEEELFNEILKSASNKGLKRKCS